VGLVFPSDLISHEFVLDENLIVLCGGDKEVGLSVSHSDPAQQQQSPFKSLSHWCSEPSPDRDSVTEDQAST
jgi:hypothetical protein